MKDERRHASGSLIHPSSFILHPSIRPAFTLIEMLTVVAALVIILGLMVSLARYVREKSANQLTQELLQRLEDVTRQYRQRTGRLPDVPAILAPDEQHSLLEQNVTAAARANNAKFVETLKSEFARTGLLEHGRDKGGFGDLPISLYNGRILCDAWGSPIVFMPKEHPAIGMAPFRPGDAEDAPAFFFFSAGADGRYLSRDDNLYSYEQARRG
jgi:prepilin-type N-terminal cleavage/methylation domain-containing protein